jgi:predicted glycosyltransferase
MRALFFLENGIGLGHQRRILQIADALGEADAACRSLILTQSRSLDLFADAQHGVLALPSLHRLGSNAGELLAWRFVDEVVAAFDPDVIVEDTHPDARFLGLPSVRHRRKVLIQRRLDPLALEHNRRAGLLGEYDRIVWLEGRERFAEGHPFGPWPALAHFSERLCFGAPIVAPVSDEALGRVRGGGEGPRVVVTAGGGGEHLDEGSCRLLYQAAAEAARRLEARHPAARWRIVLGPNYKHAPPAPSRVLRVVGFDPDLPARLRTADVVVMRPGYNAMMETLAGEARIVAVPGLSYAEAQAGWVAELVEEHGMQIAEPSPGAIELAVERALAAPPRRARLGGEGRERAARFIREVVSGPGTARPRAAVLTVPPRAGFSGIAGAGPGLQAVVGPDGRREEDVAFAFSLEGLPLSGAPPALVVAGGDSLDLWSDVQRTPLAGRLVQPAHRLSLAGARSTPDRLIRALTGPRPSSIVLLEGDGVDPATLGAELGKNGLELSSLRGVLAQQADRALVGPVFNPDTPDSGWLSSPGARSASTGDDRLQSLQAGARAVVSRLLSAGKGLERVRPDQELP